MSNPELLAKVRSQIEFYFSDSNFRKDTFLRAAAESDPDGFVPLTTILTFNKLKMLTTDPEIIVAALQESKSVLLNTEKDKMRRAEPLPIDDTSKLRTLYAKGFPLSEVKTIIDDAKDLFSKFGTVNMIRLRRDQNKAFKGSCFIEFSTPEEMQAAVAAATTDGENKLTFKGAPFEKCLSFNEWFTNKKAEKSNNKAKSTEEDPKKNENNSNKRPRDSADDDGAAEAKDDDATSTKKVEFTEGLIFKLTNVPNDITLFQIKDVVKVLTEVKFVDYTPTEPTVAYVRVATKESAEKFTTALTDGVMIIPDSPKVEWTVLAGDEEYEYWVKIDAQGAAKSAGGGRGGRGRGRGRGGRGRGGGRGGGGGRKRSRN